MSAISAFLGLLALAYLGAVAFRRNGASILGLPSGTEYLLLGFFLGPEVLGAVDPALVDAFEPLVYVCLSWIGLSGGIRFGTLTQGRAPTKLVVASLAWAVVTAGLVFGVTYGGLTLLHLHYDHRLKLALALAIVGSETSPFAVRWALSRKRIEEDVPEKDSHSVEDVVTTVAHTDEIISMALLAYLLATLPARGGTVIAPALPWSLGTIAVGLLLGLLGGLLLGKSLGRSEAMTFLVGATVLGTGLGVELGLAFPALAFSLGLGLQLFSPHRAELEQLIESGEEAMVYPMLLLAGLRIQLGIGWFMAGLLALGLLARLLGKYLTGLGLARYWLGRGQRLGLTLGSSGAMAISLGFTLALVEGGPLGNAALVFAALATLVGDITSPLSLRKSLSDRTTPTGAPLEAVR